MSFSKEKKEILTWKNAGSAGLGGGALEGEGLYGPENGGKVGRRTEGRKGKVSLKGGGGDGLKEGRREILREAR